MSQKLLENLDDFIVFFFILYITLVLFGLLKYPTESWKLKVEKLKETKWYIFLKVLMPILALGFLAKIIITIWNR